MRYLKEYNEYREELEMLSDFLAEIFDEYHLRQIKKAPEMITDWMQEHKSEKWWYLSNSIDNGGKSQSKYGHIFISDSKENLKYIKGDIIQIQQHIERRLGLSIELVEGFEIPGIAVVIEELGPRRLISENEDLYQLIDIIKPMLDKYNIKEVPHINHYGIGCHKQPCWWLNKYIIIIEGVPTNKDYIKFSKELLKSRENIEKKLGKPVYLDTADQIKGEYAANKANKVFYLNALRPISDITTPTKHGSYNLWK